MLFVRNLILSPSKFENLRKITRAVFRDREQGDAGIDVLITPTVGNCYTRNAVREDPVTVGM